MTVTGTQWISANTCPSRKLDETVVLVPSGNPLVLSGL